MQSSRPKNWKRFSNFVRHNVKFASKMHVFLNFTDRKKLFSFLFEVSFSLEPVDKSLVKFGKKPDNLTFHKLFLKCFRQNIVK